MLNRVSVLIPYKPDNGIRDKTFKWVKSFYNNTMPEVEWCVGKTLSTPFNRAEAINLAAKQATRDIFVIADSDIIIDPKIIKQSILMLNEHAWIIPYSKCLDLSESSTERLLEQLPEWPLPGNIDVDDRFKDRKYNPVGGVIVVGRKNFNRVKGFDERFVGWGGEDDAFSYAMDTLCGTYKRIDDSSIYHLWHPKVGPEGNYNFENNRKLRSLYKQSKGNPEEMDELINKRDPYIIIKKLIFWM